MQNMDDVLRNLRKEYSSHRLDVSDVNPDPFIQFGQWFNEAGNAGIPEPHAMGLATVSETGFPDIRTVLLRGIERGGFTFFTNYHSRKGRDIAHNPNVGLHFFWPELERQVRVQGRAEMVSEQESDEYFNSRPRESRLGALVSQQSEVIGSRLELEQRYHALEKQYEGREIERPPNWGGYFIVPSAIEFWQGRPGRLHDRIRYHRNLQGWQLSRLQP